MTEETSGRSSWLLFGQRLPREEIVFFCQVVVIFTVIVCSIYNLSASHPLESLWVSLLSSGIGYLLPGPTLKSKDVLHNPTQ